MLPQLWVSFVPHVVFDHSVSAAELDRMRTSTLKRWLESDAGPAHEAAWQLFEMLLRVIPICK